jgi:hypothetical protein
MIGSDIWVNSPWDNCEQIMELNRKWFSQFPRAKVKKFAFRNAERLFGQTSTNV